MSENVTVIGGGLAGMASAIRLAGEEYNVTIIEKGERLGGKLNQRMGKGYIFDTGPSILTLPWVLEELFESVGKDVHDYLDIQRIEPGWRTFFEDGTKIDLTSDLPKMLEELKKVSKDDASRFFEYLDYCNKMYDLSMKSFYRDSISGVSDLRANHSLKEMWAMDPFHSLNQTTERFFKDKHLQQLFNFLIMYIGSSPYEAPAMLSQMTHVQLGVGVYYVQGGMYKIAEAMESVLEEQGVNIRLNTEVEKVTTKKKQVKEVHLAGGDVLTPDLVVSNLEVIPFYEHLMESKKLRKKALADRKKFEPTVSGLVFLLGVDSNYENLSHHNFFFSEDPEKEFQQIFKEKKPADDPTVYVGISSKSDSSQAPAGKENMFVLTHVPALQKGEDWNNNMAEYRDIILSKLERMGMTGLRDRIEYEHTFTPNDIESLYGSNGGSIYGVVTDRKLNGGFKMDTTSSVVDNLYFVGGATHPGGGVPMVTLSGHMAANAILKKHGSPKKAVKS